MTYVLGVAGPIGAGKSAIADELAAAYAGVRRSFGGVVRRRAEALGRPTDRDSLQQLGDEIIATDGWDTFCREVLDDAPQHDVVVVDGVRHVGAIDALIAIVGEAQFRLVFVDAARIQRVARVMARDEITEAAFDAAESHPNEYELPLVRERADVQVDNGSSQPEGPRRCATEAVIKLESAGFVPT